MRKNNINKSIITMLTLISLFSTSVFAKTFSEDAKAPPEENNRIESPNGADNNKGGGSNTKPGGGNSNSSYNKPGSPNNPYIRKISVPAYLQYDTHIKPVFNRLAAGEGNTKVTAYDFTRANGSSHTSKVTGQTNSGEDVYVKWLYPNVTVTRTTNKKIREVDRKNDFFEWQTSGPENWTKKTDSNRLTHTFSKVGKYKIVYTPHQLVTTSHQNFTNTKAVAYYPANGSSTTLLTKDTAGQLTTKTEGVWRTDYRQIWEFEITAADVGRPIPIGPDTPPQNIVIDPNDPKLWESETQLIH